MVALVQLMALARNHGVYLRTRVYDKIPQRFNFGGWRVLGRNSAETQDPFEPTGCFT